MKIETRDRVPETAPDPESATTQARTQTRSLFRRAGIALAFACVLVLALRWAINTTNANARQVSSTLTTLQDRIEKPAIDGDPFPEGRYGKLKAHRSSSNGPVLEPADTR